MPVFGKKQVLLLGVMALLVSGLVGAYYLILQPREQDIEKDLRTVKNQIAQRQSETQTIRNDFEELNKIKFRYGTLSKMGFLKEQNRLSARRSINEMRDLAGVLSAKYELKPVETVDHEKSKEVDHSLLKTPIEFTVGAYDDVDIYRFIYFLDYGFPGQIVIKNIEIDRIKDLTIPVLQGIGTGSNLPLVKAKISADWYSLVPIEQGNEEEEG